MDGKNVKNLGDFRAQSPQYVFFLPEGNMWELPVPEEGKTFSGVSDGYYVMLEPLPPGDHTIHWKGRFADDEGETIFALEVTYYLSVE